MQYVNKIQDQSTRTINNTLSGRRIFPANISITSRLFRPHGLQRLHFSIHQTVKSNGGPSCVVSNCRSGHVDRPHVSVISGTVHALCTKSTPLWNSFSFHGCCPPPSLSGWNDQMLNAFVMTITQKTLATRSSQAKGPSICWSSLLFLIFLLLESRHDHH